MICASGIAPFDNDLRKGGTAHKICMTRAGGEVAAKKDSYKRVYRDDGTYHYPRIAENMLRRKGEQYFESWEITGSKEKAGKTPKFPLTLWIKNIFWVALLDVVQRLEHETGRRIHVRGQWDNASPHVEKAVL